MVLVLAGLVFKPRQVEVFGEMWILLKMELSKGFKSKWMILSVLIGCTLAVVSAIGNIQECQRYLTLFASVAHEKYIGPSVYSCYADWMSVDGYQTPTWLFYRLAPLLACLPYAWTFGKELATHYFDQLSIRAKREDILTAKCVAAFLTGAVVVLVPQLLNFLLLACFEPAITPNIVDSMYIGIFEENLFSDVFYTNPLLYVFMYSFMSAGLCGLWSVLVLGISGVAVSKIVSLVAPYIGLLVLQFLNENIFVSLLGGVRGVQLSLFENLRAMTGMYIQNGWLILAEAVLMLVVGVLLMARRVKRDLL